MNKKPANPTKNPPKAPNGGNQSFCITVCGAISSKTK